MLKMEELSAAQAALPAERKFSDIVKKAECVLEKSNWIKALYGDHKWVETADGQGEEHIGAFCVMGALNAADLETTAYDRLAHVGDNGTPRVRELLHAASTRSYEMVRFNDGIAYTKKHVIERLKSIRAILEAKDL